MTPRTTSGTCCHPSTVRSCSRLAPLASRPSIILADEPTGALDSRSGAEVMALLRQLADAGHTIILVTHDSNVAAHADRLIEIADGLISSDSGSRLRTAPAVPSDVLALPDGGRIGMVGDAYEAAKMALRALRRNLFRTILTLLGIVIGVSTVIAMVSLIAGFNNSVTASFESFGATLVQFQKFDPQFGPGEGRDPAPWPRSG